jgi:hypothetical protein
LLWPKIFTERNKIAADCLALSSRTFDFFSSEIRKEYHMNDVQEIQRRLIELDVEHRDLDAVITLLTQDGHHDQLQLRRLKKRKLQLKDHITLLKMQLVPDVPA